MARIEYEQPLGPGRPDKIAPGDKARREQNRRRKDSERQGSVVGKRGDRSDDNKERADNAEAPGRRVDLEA